MNLAWISSALASSAVDELGSIPIFGPNEPEPPISGGLGSINRFDIRHFRKRSQVPQTKPTGKTLIETTIRHERDNLKV
jgi:hypothetical protein